MGFINSDGSLNALKVANQIKTTAKGINDSIYYCFEELENEKRLIALEAYNNLLTLANAIEKEEDEFFNEA
jgi:hypothetical protein